MLKKHGDLPACLGCLPCCLCLVMEHLHHTFESRRGTVRSELHVFTTHPRWLKNRPFAFRNGMIPAPLRCSVRDERSDSSRSKKLRCADTSRFQGDVPVICRFFVSFSIFCFFFGAVTSAVWTFHSVFSGHFVLLRCVADFFLTS